MKRLIVALGLSALMMGTSALADSVNEAWVIDADDGQRCGVALPMWGIFGTWYGVQTKSGNWKIICELEDADPEKFKVKRAWVTGIESCKYFSRTHGVVEATDSKFVLTPSGEARMECSFKANKAELD